LRASWRRPAVNTESVPDTDMASATRADKTLQAVLRVRRIQSLMQPSLISD
jgi:hypothetical protein